MVNTLLKRAAGDIAVYFPGKLLPALTSVITVPIFARLFPPEEYGVLAVLTSFAAIGGIAVGNWLTSSVMRFLPLYRRKERLGQFYGTLIGAFLLSLLVYFLFTVPLYFFCEGAFSPQIYRLLPIVGMLVSINTLYAILQTILRADQKPRQFVGFELFQVYGGLLLGISLVVVFGFGVEGILFGSLAITVVTCVGITWHILHEQCISEIKYSSITLREFAKYGLPGGLATIGTWILALSDRYIIEYFRGTAEVGIYAMGYNIGDKTVNLVVSSLMLAVSPILINTWESDHRSATPLLLSQLTRLFILLIVPVVTMLAILAVSIFQILTTPAYLAAAPILPWVALGAFLYALSLLAYTGLILAKKTVVMARNYLLAGLFNVGMNLIFVPQYGFMAAAVNTALAYGLLLALNVFSSVQYLPWLFPWLTLRNVLIASAIMALPLWLGSELLSPSIWTLSGNVIIGAALYLGMLVATHEISATEKQAVMSWISQAWKGLKIRLVVWLVRKGAKL